MASEFRLVVQTRPDRPAFYAQNVEKTRTARPRSSWLPRLYGTWRG